MLHKKKNPQEDTRGFVKFLYSTEVWPSIYCTKFCGGFHQDFGWNFKTSSSDKYRCWFFGHGLLGFSDLELGYWFSGHLDFSVPIKRHYKYKTLLHTVQ